MEPSDNADRGYSTWRAWLGRARWLVRESESGDIRITSESWTLDAEAYDGGGMLLDYCGERDEAVGTRCIARLLVVRIVADAVRRQRRAEDLSDDVAEATEYLNELELPLEETRVLRRLLSALAPYDPAAIASELLRLCWFARAEGLDASARSCAELAYETAVAAGLDDAAQGAALALARLATMQECPRTARKWRGLAHVHMLRAWRTRTPASSARHSRPR